MFPDFQMTAPRRREKECIFCDFGALRPPVPFVSSLCRAVQWRTGMRGIKKLSTTDELCPARSLFGS